jgi:hypothetical protein
MAVVAIEHRGIAVVLDGEHEKVWGMLCNLFYGWYPNGKRRVFPPIRPLLRSASHTFHALSTKLPQPIADPKAIAQTQWTLNVFSSVACCSLMPFSPAIV